MLRGDAGRDRIQAFGAPDRVIGGAGGDPCLNTDDGRGQDVIVGGAGFDVYVIDEGDRAVGVERRGDFPCEIVS